MIKKFINENRKIISDKIKKRKKLTFLIISFLFIQLLLLGLFNVGFLSNIDNIITDNLYGGRVEPLSNIIIISIDDDTQNILGQFPFDRKYYAILLDKLNQSSVIGFDVAFFDSSNPKSDKLLETKIKSHRDKIVLPTEFISFKTELNSVRGNKLLKPIDIFNTTDTGYINVITDADGIIRSINPFLSSFEKPFAQKVTEKYLGKNITLPKDSNNLLINFVGPAYSYKYLSFQQIVTENISADFFKDKIVLIGSSSEDLHDNYLVPTSKERSMPGVEVHANAIQTMITKNYLKSQTGLELLLYMSIITLFIFLMGYYFQKSGIATFITLFLVILNAILKFDSGYKVNILYQVLSVILSYLIYLLYIIIFTKHEKKQLLNAFSKYVSPVLIKELTKRPDLLKLGGENREITVFFSDIRGFTTISEKLSPEDLVHLLNEYLTEMTEIILENKGLVDKYMGDAIMAFWNAPLDTKDHATIACDVSLMMINRLKLLQQKWVKNNIPSFDIGIGLNTGNAVVGNMGSTNRFDYTAMGDTINLGSRLESINKQYGTNIIISETTFKSLKENSHLCRKLDRVRVKGKNIPITIYELMASTNPNITDIDTFNKKLIIKDKFEEGLECYFKGDFKTAKKIFNSKELKEDKPSQIFIKRCDYFIQNPVDKDWSGVWTMTTK